MEMYVVKDYTYHNTLGYYATYQAARKSLGELEGVRYQGFNYRFCYTDEEKKAKEILKNKPFECQYIIKGCLHLYSIKPIEVN